MSSEVPLEAGRPPGRHEPIEAREVTLSIVLYFTRSARRQPTPVQLEALSGAVVDLLLVDTRLASERSEDEVRELHDWAGTRSGVVWLERPGAQMTRAKGEALSRARGDLVCFLDSSVWPKSDWSEGVRRAFAQHPAAVAIGGAVGCSPRSRSSDRALYLYEYAAFCPPVPAGPTSGDLPGSNVVYRRRQLLEACQSVLDELGFNKPFVHEALRGAGDFRLSTFEVEQSTALSLLEASKKLFHHARCFGDTRRARAVGRRRTLLILGAPAAPLWLAGRHLRASFAGPGPAESRAGLVARFQRVALATSWGVGEWMGCWMGAGGSEGEFR